MIKRAGDYKYKIVLTEIKYSEFEGSNEEKIKRITQEYMTILENAVRENPEQWFWMHKIWKY
jgi:KDO2-lipid IV(A) lauroyltransferase